MLEYALFESGNAIKSSTKIPANIAINLSREISKKLSDELGVRTTVYGSVGKKAEGEKHGDLDIGIELQYNEENILKVKEAVHKLFADNIVEEYESKELKLYSFGYKWDEGCVAQVDCMLQRNIDFGSFAYHSPDYKNKESNFKGLWRTNLLVEIVSQHPIDETKYKPDYWTDEFDGQYRGQIKRFWKYSFDYQEGIVVKHKSYESTAANPKKPQKNPHTIKEDTILFTDKPEEIVKFALGKDATLADVNSFESIVNYMATHWPKEKAYKVFESFFEASNIKNPANQADGSLERAENYVREIFKSINEDVASKLMIMKYKDKILNEKLLSFEDVDSEDNDLENFTEVSEITARKKWFEENCSIVGRGTIPNIPGKFVGPVKYVIVQKITQTPSQLAPNGFFDTRKVNVMLDDGSYRIVLDKWYYSVSTSNSRTTDDGLFHVYDPDAPRYTGWNFIDYDFKQMCETGFADMIIVEVNSSELKKLNMPSEDQEGTAFVFVKIDSINNDYNSATWHLFKDKKISKKYITVNKFEEIRNINMPYSKESRLDFLRALRDAFLDTQFINEKLLSFEDTESEDNDLENLNKISEIAERKKWFEKNCQFVVMPHQGDRYIPITILSINGRMEFYKKRGKVVSRDILLHRCQNIMDLETYEILSDECFDGVGTVNNLIEDSTNYFPVSNVGQKTNIVHYNIFDNKNRKLVSSNNWFSKKPSFQTKLLFNNAIFYVYDTLFVPDEKYNDLRFFNTLYGAKLQEQKLTCTFDLNGDLYYFSTPKKLPNINLNDPDFLVKFSEYNKLRKQRNAEALGISDVNEKLLLFEDTETEDKDLDILNKITKYKYFPKDRDELYLLVTELIKDRGPNANLNDICTSQITDMSFMFYENVIIKNIDISEWDVSNVTTMAAMFFHCPYFNCDLSKWDVSKLTKAMHMFNGCKSLDSNFNTWSIPNLHGARAVNMFKGCKKSIIPNWYDPKTGVKKQKKVNEKLLSFEDVESQDNDMENLNRIEADADFKEIEWAYKYIFAWIKKDDVLNLLNYKKHIDDIEIEEFKSDRDLCIIGNKIAMKQLDGYYLILRFVTSDFERYCNDNTPNIPLLKGLEHLDTSDSKYANQTCALLDLVSNLNNWYKPKVISGLMWNINPICIILYNGCGKTVNELERGVSDTVSDLDRILSNLPNEFIESIKNQNTLFTLITQRTYTYYMNGQGQIPNHRGPYTVYSISDLINDDVVKTSSISDLFKTTFNDYDIL